MYPAAGFDREVPVPLSKLRILEVINVWVTRSMPAISYSDRSPTKRAQPCGRDGICPVVGSQGGKRSHKKIYHFIAKETVSAVRQMMKVTPTENVMKQGTDAAFLN
jgi:hypothetical protein